MCREKINLMNNCSVSWGCCGSKDINSGDGDVHKLVKKVTDRERVPIFPPGEILHIAVNPQNKSW